MTPLLQRLMIFPILEYLSEKPATRGLFAFLERAMGQHQQQPSKQVVRQYMEGRQREHKPPPSQKEIRRQLGWDLVEMQRAEQAGRR